MAPDERASAQHRFMSGDADVIVATNAFGMGIDKADVRSVWHWAIPTSVEAYYQEAGRAGRDGLPARAVLLAGRSDLGRLVRFIQQRSVEPEAVAAYVERLRAHADSDGAAGDRQPPQDEERIRLAIAERAGACTVEPAPGGRLLRHASSGELDRGARRRRLPRRQGPRLARLPGGRGLQLLGDLPPPQACSTTSATATPGAARGALLRRLRPGRAGCPPRRRSRSGRRGRAGAGRAPAPELSAGGRRPCSRRCKAWRLRRRGRQARLHGGPQPHPRGDRGLAPGRSRAASRSIHGVGPGVRRRATRDEVLELVAAA